MDAPDKPDGVPESIITAQRWEPGRIPGTRVPMAKRTVLLVELLSLAGPLLSAGGRGDDERQTQHTYQKLHATSFNTRGFSPLSWRGPESGPDIGIGELPV